MDEPKRKIYDFGGFRLDALRLSLGRSDGGLIPLKPKACEILLVLIERRGQVVSKEELMRLVWPNAHVEESNLTVNLSMLRKALGETADRQRFIVTVPGKGYRFVGDLTGDTEEARMSAKRGLATSSKKNTFLRLSVITILLAAIGVTAFFMVRGKPAPVFQNFRLNKLTTSGKVVTAGISPDGKYLAYVINESGGQSVWLKQLSAASDMQIVPRETEVHYPGIAFSNDGERLYLLKSGKEQPNTLYRIGLLGGNFEKLADDVDSLPAISPDGKTLAYMRGLPDSNETALFTLGTGGGEPAKLVSRASIEGFELGVRPAWSADGAKIVSAVRKQDEKGKYEALATIDPRTGKLDEIPVPRFLRVWQLAWASGGTGLIVAGETEESPGLSQIAYVAYPGGQTRRITNDLNDYRELSITADGKTISTINTDLQTNIWTAPLDGSKEPNQVTSTNYDGARGLAWSPDGSLIYTSRTSENLDLWRLAPDGSKQQLTSGAGNNFQPAVSPDGRSIAFVSTRAGVQNIWKAEMDGSSLFRYTEGIDDTGPNWSPDGNYLAYSTYIDGNPSIFKVDTTGRIPYRVTEKISGRPQFSPDGTSILCSYRPEATGTQRVSLIPASGGEPERTFPFTSSLFRWEPDGKSFLFVNHLVDGGVSLWRQALDPAVSPAPLTSWAGDRIYWFDLSRDGKTLAIARGTSQSDVVLITDSPEQK